MLFRSQQAQSGGYQGGFYNPTYNDSMLAWLKRDLQATNKPWKIVFFHKPIFMNWLENQGWDTIMEDYGVQLVLNGHLHYYYAHERNSVTYIIAAGGGAGIGYINAWEWPEYMIGGFRDHHFLQVDVTDSMLQTKAFDNNDVLRHWINVDPTGKATYPPLETVDNFEEYEDDIGIMGAWEYTGRIKGLDKNQISLATDSTKNSKVMKIKMNFSANGTDGYGYTGYPALWNWENYKAIRLWVKSSITGYSDQYVQVRIHEGTTNGKLSEKWKSPQIDLSSLDPNGEYVYLYFDDFTKYADDGGTLVNNKMDLDKIYNFFIIPGFNGTSTAAGTATIFIDDITAVTDSLSTTGESVLPGKFRLYQNYPNPFNPVTTIQYNLPVTGNVQLTVYDISGREITTLVNGQLEAGSHSVKWDGRIRNGEKVASGVYIYRLKMDNYLESKKLLLIK